MQVVQRCPQCKTVGKVQRSRTNGILEVIQRKIMPWFGMYRCHHCNWRGRLPRAGFSRSTAMILSVAVLIVLLAVGIALLYALTILIRPAIVD